jgi:hypothetical protein
MELPLMAEVRLQQVTLEQRLQSFEQMWCIHPGAGKRECPM